jgi:hypothetical protein
MTLFSWRMLPFTNKTWVWIDKKNMLKNYQIPNNRVLNEDLTVVWLAKKYSALYETQNLICMIMTIYHCSLS